MLPCFATEMLVFLQVWQLSLISDKGCLELKCLQVVEGDASSYFFFPHLISYR